MAGQKSRSAASGLRKPRRSGLEHSKGAGILCAGDRQQRAFQGSSSKTLWREDHQLFAHHGDSVHPRVRRGHFGGLNAAKPPQPLLSAREQQTAGARRDAPYR